MEGDAAAMAAWIGKESQAFTDAMGGVAPLVQADLILLRTMAARALKPAHFFWSAKEITELVPLIPPAEVYDPDRARLYGLAAGLIIRGVAQEARPRSIVESYQRMAHYAVSFLNRALELNADDPTGVLRRQRAIALAQAGLQEEALHQARALVSAKPESADARYALARLLCSSGAIDLGLDQLEKSIELGFDKLAEARVSNDFPKADRRFRSLVDVQLVVRGARASQALTVRNRSPFPLNDVVFRVDFATAARGKRDARAEATLFRLEPGESFTIYLDATPAVVSTTVDGREQVQWNGELTVTARGQGTTRAAIPDRR